METCEGQCEKNLRRLIGISIDGDTETRRGPSPTYPDMGQ